jgi:antitoxin ParD1/3/4
MATMNVSLPAGLAKHVEDLVEGGQYSSASEVVRSALRLLLERERHMAWIRGEVQKGFDSIDRGESVPYSPELIDQIIADGHNRAKAIRESDPSQNPNSVRSR